MATPFELRPIATELMLCQRYYEVISLVAGGYNMGYSPGGVATNLMFVFKSSKRITPTIVSVNTVIAGKGTLATYITKDTVAYFITASADGFFYYIVNNDLRLDAEL